jgi:hypothetical protein
MVIVIHHVGGSGNEYGNASAGTSPTLLLDATASQMDATPRHVRSQQAAPVGRRDGSELLRNM